jgi:hypothetical protein
MTVSLKTRYRTGRRRLRNCICYSEAAAGRSAFHSTKTPLYRAPCNLLARFDKATNTAEWLTFRSLRKFVEGAADSAWQPGGGHHVLRAEERNALW